MNNTNDSFNTAANKLTIDEVNRRTDQQLNSLHTSNSRKLRKYTLAKLFQTNIKCGGKELLGEVCFSAIFNQNKIPSLQNLTHAASALGRVVELVAEPSHTHMAGTSLLLNEQLDPRKLCDHLMTLRAIGIQQAEPEVENFLQQQLAWLSKEDARTTWYSLVKFHTACGFNLKIKLRQKRSIARSRQTAHPQSLKEVHSFAKQQLSVLDQKISHHLLFRMQEQCRLQKQLNDIPFEITTSKIIERANMGKSVFLDIIRKRLPALENLIRLATFLEMTVEIQARRFNAQKALNILVCTRELNRQTLITMLEKLNRNCYFNQVDPAVESYRKNQLQSLPQLNTSISWQNLIRFYAACGYELDIRLAPKIEIGNGRLLSRLDYPL